MSSYSVVWVVIALVFGSIEVVVTSFAFLLAGLSALIAAVFATLHAPFEVQVIVFAITMVLSLIFVRPILKNKFKRTARLPGRAEALVGKAGVVVVSFQQNQGRVEIDGEDWSARSQTDPAQGATIKVIGHDGIVLIVQ